MEQIESQGRRQHRVLALVGLGLAALGAAAAVGLSVHAGTSTGPDVTVIYLPDTINEGGDGTYRGYAVGTTSCNIGDQPVMWCNSGGGCGLGSGSEDHPVIAQNIYRLKNGRFEQIGMSWLKHGFLSTNSDDVNCNGLSNCSNPPLGGDQLGLGCTDTYDAGLNDNRPLGRRSEVNAKTGIFPYPYGTGGASSTVYDQRVKVLQTDVEPALNPDARYWIEGQYVTSDDAAAGNGLNNASYREVTVNAGTYNLSFVGGTIREVPAIAAWPVVDATVELVDADAPTTPVERFHVARKVTEPTPGTWHYEYAIHNLNSDDSARSFTVDFAVPTTFTNIGFHDIEHHSNEPYATTDWVSATTADALSWSTETFAQNANANALRWGTMFSFWFDANTAPSNEVHSLGLFKSGGTLPIPLGSSEIFADGFETGDTSAWTQVVP